MATDKRVHGQVVFEPGDPEWKEGWRYGYETEAGWLLVKVERSVEFVASGAYLLPRAFQVLAEWSDLPYSVGLSYEYEDGDAPMCTQVILIPQRRVRRYVPAGTPRADGRRGIAGQLVWAERSEITAEGLRKLPVRRLQQAALLAAVHDHPVRKNARPKPKELKDWAELYAAMDNPPRRRPGDRLDDDHYRAVAETYRDAATGWAPTEAVAAAFHVSRSTAGRWVMETRNRGFLGPTEKGRAGELG